MEEHGFTWVEAVGLDPHYGHTITALLIALLVVVLGWLARRRHEKAEDPLVPDGRPSARDLFEIVTSWLSDLAEGLIGHGGRRFVPLFATLFLYILFSNLIGLVPGFLPPTDNFNTTFGLAIVSFAAYNWWGYREHGLPYLRQFLGPALMLAPLMVIVELISHVFRPVSLAIRLFGNMFADHLVLNIFTDLTKLVVPVAFYMLGAFVSLVQAFVFTILTMVYVALAVSHDH